MDFSFRNLKKFVSENLLFEESQNSNDNSLYNQQYSKGSSGEKEILNVCIKL